jgi:protein tyrosine phosphatase
MEDFINPKTKIENVFIFSIAKLRELRKDDYEATRQYWKINNTLRALNPSFAIGCISYQSAAVFEIESWEDPNLETGKTLFTKKTKPNQKIIAELSNKNWSKLLKQSGSYLYGQPIVVEFDGKGKFRFIKGAKDKDTWHNCI